MALNLHIHDDSIRHNVCELNASKRHGRAGKAPLACVLFGADDRDGIQVRANEFNLFNRCDADIELDQAAAKTVICAPTLNAHRNDLLGVPIAACDEAKFAGVIEQGIWHLGSPILPHHTTPEAY